jgi:hypothetical protein
MKYGFNISLLWHNRSMHAYSRPNNYLHLLFYSVLDYILIKSKFKEEEDSISRS